MNSFYVLFSLLLTVFSVNKFSLSVNAESQECRLRDEAKCGYPENTNNLDDSSHEKDNNFYTKVSNEILSSLNNALRKYKSCADLDDETCSCHAQVIDNDLQPFRSKGITQENIASAAKYGTRYKILNHKMYREERCMFPARCSGIEHFIKPLLPSLKDMDLIVNTRDWPQIRSGFGRQLPVFSFSKTHDYSDIMYPAWSFWAGGPAIALHPTGIGRWDLQRDKLAQAAIAMPWSKKISKGFFRGSRTSDERDSLVLLSRRRPELVDAQYTKNQAWKSPKDTLHAEPAQEVSFEDHCQYKYLFNFRGVAASFRLKHLFLCKSLVFHVGNEWNEFFYFAMKPWVHYVPLSSYPSEEELESILQFFQKNDKLAQEIADRGYQFIWQHLRMKDVQCYWERLLSEYQKLMRYKIEPEDDLLEK